MVTTEAFEAQAWLPGSVVFYLFLVALVLGLVGWALSKFDVGDWMIGTAAVLWILFLVLSFINFLSVSRYDEGILSEDLSEQAGISQIIRGGSGDSVYWTGKDEDGKFVRFALNEIPDRENTYKISYLD